MNDDSDQVAIRGHRAAPPVMVSAGGPSAALVEPADSLDCALRGQDGAAAAGRQSAAHADTKERGDAALLRSVLRRDLASGRWRDGDKLPTERALGERYGVARNTVRRALDALQEEGLIVRHVGRGTFKAPGEALAPQQWEFRGASPADVLECRLVFEPGFAALVVARATGADLDRMEECLRRADAATDALGFEVWDSALHDAFAVATRNQTMIAMARALAKVRQEAEWGQLKARSMTPERKIALQVEHRAIVDAFRRRDKDAARDRLRAHILHVQDYMFGD